LSDEHPIMEDLGMPKANPTRGTTRRVFHEGCIPRGTAGLSLSRPTDPLVAKAGGGRLESNSLGFKSLDRNRIENETRISISHSRPEKTPARMDCESTAERLRWIGKVAVNDGGQNTFDLAGDQRAWVCTPSVRDFRKHARKLRAYVPLLLSLVSYSSYI